jgi:hypothetical protein
MNRASACPAGTTPKTPLWDIVGSYLLPTWILHPSLTSLHFRIDDTRETNELAARRVLCHTERVRVCGPGCAVRMARYLRKLDYRGLVAGSP